MNGELYEGQTGNDWEMSQLPHGWIVEARVSEQNLENAISKAHEMVEGFLTAFSVETGSEVFRSFVISGYDITENLMKREFRQYVRDIHISFMGKKIGFSDSTQNIKKIWNARFGAYSDRIYRAMRWFRKGLIGDDPIDQFVFFWHGLEALNSALAVFYKVEKRGKIEIDRECKVCGGTYKDCVDSKKGIEKLFEDIGLDRQARKEINDIRNGIAHGFENISQLSVVSTKLLPIMARLLYVGISKVIGLTCKDEVIENLNRVSPLKIGEAGFFEMNLFGKDSSQLGANGYYPYFIHTVEEVDGKLKSTITPKINCNYETIGFAISGTGVKVNVTDVR